MIMVLVGIISPEVGIIYYWRGQEHNWANLGEAKLKARCHTRFMVWSTLLTLYTACLHHTPHTGKVEGYAGAREGQKWKQKHSEYIIIIIKWLLHIVWYYSYPITSFGVQPCRSICLWYKWGQAAKQGYKGYILCNYSCNPVVAFLHTCSDRQRLCSNSPAYLQ